MAGLTRKKVKDESTGKRTSKDPASELAEKSSSFSEFVLAFNARLKMYERTQKELWYDNSIEKTGLEWLKENFALINNGRLTKFSLPRKINIFTPMPLLADSQYRINIIDTKGVDDIAVRADIQDRLGNPHTVCVLCTSFMDAPDKVTTDLFEHLISTGAENILKERIILCVLPRSEEVFSVKYDDGEYVESADEGYEVKVEQVQNVLEKYDLGNNVPIYCFNASEDPADRINEIIVKSIQLARKFKEFRLKTLSKHTKSFLSNLDKKSVQLVIADALRKVKIFLDDNLELRKIKYQPQDKLRKTIDISHTRTVWATTRRNGMWEKLNVYFYLGVGVKVKVHKMASKPLTELLGIIKNMQKDSKMELAHKFLEELSYKIELLQGSFFSKAEYLGRDVFRDSLLRDSELWEYCEKLYGQGAGYKKSVTQRFIRWFNSRQRSELRASVDMHIQKQWREQVIDPLYKLCNSYDNVSVIKVE